MCTGASPCPPHQCDGGYSCEGGDCVANRIHRPVSGVGGGAGGGGGRSGGLNLPGSAPDLSSGSFKTAALVTGVGLAALAVGLVGKHLQDEADADEEAALAAEDEQVRAERRERAMRYSKLIDALGEDKAERVITFLTPGNCFVDNTGTRGLLIRTESGLIVEVNKGAADTIAGDQKALDRYARVKAASKEHCIN